VSETEPPTDKPSQGGGCALLAFLALMAFITFFTYRKLPSFFEDDKTRQQRREMELKRAKIVPTIIPKKEDR
jgi:hypothetical protein